MKRVLQFLILLLGLWVWGESGASARPCQPYDPLADTDRGLTIGADDNSSLSNLVTHTITLTAEGHAPDLYWNQHQGVVTGPDDWRVAERILDACMFARVISKWRMTAAIEALAKDHPLPMMIWPPPRNGRIYYEGDRVDLSVRPPLRGQSAYMIVFSLDGAGAIGHHFPVERFGDGEGLVEGDSELRPYGHRGSTSIAEPFGAEHLIAVASSHPPDPTLARDLDVLQSVLLLNWTVAGAQKEAHMLCERSERKCPLDDYESLVRPVFERVMALAKKPDSGIGIVRFDTAQKPSTGGENQDPESSTKGPRIALVIGNEGYGGSEHLTTPVRDAEAIAGVFRKQGFELLGNKAWTDVKLADLKRIRSDLYDWTKRMSPEVVVIYYAGHGVGTNRADYLIPVGAKLKSARDLHSEARTAQWLIEAAEKSEHRILIFDACRSNEFPLEGRSVMGPDGILETAMPGGGLGQQELENSVQFYSTMRGQVASDGNGPHSPFARSFLKHIRARAGYLDVFQRITGDFPNCAERRCRNAGQRPQLYLNVSTWPFHFEPE